jgi:hypothetical membrane protein
MTTGLRVAYRLRIVRLSLKHRSLLALGGIAGPAIFTITTVVAAGMRPGYSHVDNLISELGATNAPHASIMNVGGFIPCGLLLVALAAALWQALPARRMARAGAVLVAAFGCGVAASGVFSCDLGCPQNGGSVEHLIHQRIAPIIFVALIAATAMLGREFSRLSTWRHLAAYSWATSAQAFVFMALLINSLDTRTLSGLWQRLMIACLFLWCAIIGVAVFRQLRRASSLPSQRRTNSVRESSRR